MGTLVVYFFPLLSNRSMGKKAGIGVCRILQAPSGKNMNALFFLQKYVLLLFFPKMVILAFKAGRKYY